MTSSENNAEQPGSTETTVGNKPAGGTPPWQRVTEDSTEQTITTGTAVNPTVSYEGVDDTAGSWDTEETGQQRRGGMSLGDVAGSRREPPSALRRPGRGPRRASLQLKRLDPWSVLKLSLVFGAMLFVIWLVAVGVLYFALDGMGVWDQLNGAYSSLLQGEGSGDGGEPLISATRVFFFAAVVGAINLVLLTALATIGSFIYNVSADLAGGLELTLSERE